MVSSQKASTASASDLSLNNAQKSAGAAGVANIAVELGTAYAQARALRAQRKYQLQQVMFNASLAKRSADDAIRRGAVASDRKLRDTNRLVQAQMAALAAQGIDISSGTALAIQQETYELGAEDARTIRTNAYREAFGYRLEAVNLESQARFGRIAGKFKEKSTILTGQAKAGSQLAQSAATMGSMG